MKTNTPLLRRFSLSLGLFILVGLFQVNAAPFPATNAGSYEGPLQTDVLAEETPSPFGMINFTVSTTGGVTGSIRLLNKLSYPFTMTLASNDSQESTATKAIVKSKTGATLVTLTLTVKPDGTFTAMGNSTLPTVAGGSFENVPSHAVKLALFNTTTNKCPWRGAYTMSLTGPTPVNPSNPTNSGYATMTISSTGAATLIGRLGDNALFTITGKTTATASYRCLGTPYSVLGSYFSMNFSLSTRTSDGKYHIADSAAPEVAWLKKPAPSDKLFPEGFGPLDVLVKASPWAVPAAGQNVRSVLDLDITDAFPLGFETLIPSTYNSRIPTAFTVTNLNKLRVALGAQGSPSVNSPLTWATFFTGTISPTSGKITATVKIRDNKGTVSKPIWYYRSVTFNGVAFQLEEGDTSPLVTGISMLPPYPTTGSPILTDYDFDYQDLFTDTGLAYNLQLGGRYTVMLDMLTPAPGNPAPTVTLPSTTRPVPFTLSADLKTITFNGKTIGLQAGGDSRPVSLSYTNARISPFNNLTITIFTGFDGKITGLNANYYQVTKSGYIPTVRIRNFVSEGSETIIKQP